jgi:lysophospholipase L1-like esterase
MRKTVFFGDSITEGFTTLSFVPNVVNLGVSGDKTINLIGRIQEVITINPSTLFLMIGINDLLVKERYWQDYITIDFEKVYDTLLTLIRDNLPKCDVYLSSVLPIDVDKDNNDYLNKRIIMMNEYIREMSLKYNYKYLNLHKLFLSESNLIMDKYTTDGVHLSDKGYELYLNTILELIDYE